MHSCKMFNKFGRFVSLMKSDCLVMPMNVHGLDGSSEADPQ